MKDASSYYNQLPPPAMPWSQPPPAPSAPPAPVKPVKPARPWPLRAVNRWMSFGLIALTLLAVLLAVLAPHAVSAPPSTAGFTLDYQSSLTQNSTGNKTWDEDANCQFTSTGYMVTAPDPDHAQECLLQGTSYQNFILRVRVVNAEQTAVIGFLGDDRLAIFDVETEAGRFQLYQSDPVTGNITYLIPRTGVGAGSIAIHPVSLGVSDRANEIIIQVQQQTYSFYANGQLLATYQSPTLEDPGPISLGTAGGETAEFSDIAIYVPTSSA